MKNLCSKNLMMISPPLIQNSAVVKISIHEKMTKEILFSVLAYNQRAHHSNIVTLWPPNFRNGKCFVQKKGHVCSGRMGKEHTYTGIGVLGTQARRSSFRGIRKDNQNIYPCSQFCIHKKCESKNLKKKERGESAEKEIQKLSGN